MVSFSVYFLLCLYTYTSLLPFSTRRSHLESNNFDFFQIPLSYGPLVLAPTAFSLVSRFFREFLVLLHFGRFFLFLGAIFKTIFFCDRRRLSRFFFHWEYFSRTIFSAPAGGSRDFFFDLVKYFSRSAGGAAKILPDLGKSLSHSAGGAAETLPDFGYLYLVPPEALPKFSQTREIFISFRRRRCQNFS